MMTYGPRLTRPVSIEEVLEKRADTLTHAAGRISVSRMRPGYASLSRFRVRNGMAAEVAAAFRERPHLVEGASGFIRLDVLTPEDDDSEFWLLTYWEDEASFRQWHHSHQYRDSHHGIPKGLKLDPAATELRSFRYVAS